MTRKSIVILLLLAGCTLSAQERTISKTTGKLFAMPGWDKSIEAATLGVDLSISYPVSQPGRKDYELGWKCNIAHIPYGPAGDRAGLSGFVTSPISDNLDFQLGTGFGAYTKPWQFTHDSNNKYISTCLNCVIDFGFVYSKRISDNNEMVIGAKFIHNSNGWIAKPNMGLNYVQVEVGYRIKDKKGRKLHFDEKYNSRTCHFVVLSAGICVPETGSATNRDVRPAYCIQTGYKYAVQDRRSIGLSLDIGYNFSDNFSYRQEGKRPPFPMDLGVCTLYESDFGPVSARIGIGYHFVQQVDYKRIYERAGVYFKLKNGDMAGLSVKARVARADFIEWGYIINI